MINANLLEISFMEKLFDLSNLEAMCGGDAQFMTDFITLFISSVPNTVEQVEKQRSEENWNEIGLNLHKIKPTVEMFQMNEISGLLKETERLARNEGDPDQIKANLDIIIPGLKRAVEALKPELEKYKA